MDTNLIFVIAFIVITVFGYIIKTSNFFKSQKQNINHSQSNVEIALTNRYDALVKINKAISGYCGHEASTLTETIRLRKGMTTEEMNKISEQMDKEYSNISFIAENYPELKANTNFLNLQDTILDIENTIQATRRIFNREVETYNKKVQMFPSCIIAKITNANVEEYFKAEERKLHDVELNF